MDNPIGALVTHARGCVEVLDALMADNPAIKGKRVGDDTIGNLRVRLNAAADGIGPEIISQASTIGDLAAHVGATETPEGFIQFGSWQAVRAFAIHIQRQALLGNIKPQQETHV